MDGRCMEVVILFKINFFYYKKLFKMEQEVKNMKKIIDLELGAKILGCSTEIASRP